MSPIITDVIKYASPYAPIDPNKRWQNGFSQPTKQPPCLYHFYSQLWKFQADNQD